MTRSLAASVLAAVTCLAATAAAEPGPDPAARDISRPDSGVRGRVLMSPTCPVESNPPDPKCAPRPYRTTVRIRALPSGDLVKRVHTDDDGRFRARLRPGRYRLSPRSGKSGYPRCEPRDVRVRAHRFKRVRLDCDTGIR